MNRFKLHEGINIEHLLLPPQANSGQPVTIDNEKNVCYISLDKIYSRGEWPEGKRNWQKRLLKRF
jgi:hypothetical protein